MTEISGRQFGLIAAYLLPGFIALAGMVPLFPVIGLWLAPPAQGGLGIAPPIYAVMAATVIGLIISCFRWLLIDQLHLRTGVKRPAWDDTLLDGRLRGFDYLVQNHFRYHEFCGNTLLALLCAYGINRLMGTLPFLGPGTDLGMIILLLVLFTASRDALAKYYARTGQLLGQLAEKDAEGEKMYNGNDHGHKGGSSARPRQESKPHSKSTPPAKPPENPERPAGQQK